MSVELSRAVEGVSHLAELCEQIERTRHAIATWLLRGGVQIADGDDAGAVAGWISGDGTVAYVYPEITGYYLQWLGWYALRHGATPDVAGRARAAQRWLATWAASSSPGTRIYLLPHDDDWRNRAIFFFDVAMVLRGLAWAARAGLIAPDVALTRNIESLLQRLIAADGMFEACVSTSGPGATLPQRWSTRRGGFLAKAADGVLFAAEQLPGIAGATKDAALATFEHSAHAAARAAHGETHPFLYALEGVLNRSGVNALANQAAPLAAQFAALMARADASGHLPEAAHGKGTLRLDIVAQAVRIDAMLDNHAGGDDKRDMTVATAMVNLLLRCATPEGALPFASDQRPPQLNVWTAMFAEQALTLAQFRLTGRAIPWSDACLV